MNKYIDARWKLSKLISNIKNPGHLLSFSFLFLLQEAGWTRVGL